LEHGPRSRPRAAARPTSAFNAQAVRCLLAGYGTKAWFDYVPSKANVSDEPSRVPGLAEADFVVDLASGLASTPIPLYMPEEDAWDSDAADWYAAAEDVLSAWAWELID